MRLEDYFDTRKATVAALRDWNDQQFKAEFGRDRITQLDAKLLPRALRPDTPHVLGGGDDGDRIASVIDKKSVAQRGYNRARDYFSELSPAWNHLSPDEQFMLTARFIDRDEGGGIENIMKTLYIGRTEAYRRSDFALARLAKLLFW